MKNKIKRAAAPVFLFFFFVCPFLAFLPSTVSSSDLPSHLKTSKAQTTQDRRDFSSKPYERIDELLGDATPKAYIRSALSSTHVDRDFEDNDAELLQQMKSVGSSEWIIDNKSLENLENDPQKLIPCTEPGDRVIFNLSGVQKFKRTMVIFNQLELISDSIERTETEAEHRNGVSFTCPDTVPFLIINTINFTAKDLVVEKCTESSGDSTVVVKEGSRVVFENVEISHNRNRAMYIEPNSMVALKNAQFNNGGTSHLNGSVIYATSNVSLTISNSSFIGNEADLGGVLFAKVNNVVAIKDVSFSENSADWNGGAIYLASNNNLNVENSTMSQNKANRGGVIYLESNNNLKVESSTMSQNKGINDGAHYIQKNNDLTIANSRLLANEASESGGAISSENNNNATILNSSFIRNKAIWRGGALTLVSGCHINMTNSSMKSNDAKWGGGVFLESGVVARVSSTYFSSNDASQGGGIYVSMDCDICIYSSNFTKNHAQFGGCFFGVSSSSKAQYSNLWNNSASQSGGCFYIEYSNADFKANTFDLNQAKKDGGAIHASSNALLHLKEDLVFSNSSPNGGGIALISNSRILCESGTFGKNTANRGGAVYIESQMTQIIIAQFGKSTFFDNSASQYGGGIAIKTFGSRSFDCKSAIQPCSRVLLIDTSFVSNIANHSSSAILATTTKNELIACEAWSWFDPTSFLSVSEVGRCQTDSLLKTIHNSSPPCQAWKHNRFDNKALDQVIGTFGQTINVTTKSMDGAQITGDSKSGFTLHNVRSAKEFPILIVKTIDKFGHSPAPTLFKKNALTLNSASNILEGAIAFSFKDGICNISSVSSRVPKGNYMINITTKEEDILNSTTLLVFISECGFNEELSRHNTSCQECPIGSFNFNQSISDKCVQCPETSTCSNVYIVPKNGYWHKSPCHSKVKKCIVEEACNYSNRIQILTNMTQKYTNCNFTSTSLHEYEKNQCNKGYRGRLCGSCKKSYGCAANLYCVKCGPTWISVLRLLLILLWLFVTTTLTLKGTLPIASRSLARSVAMIPIHEGVNAALLQERTSTQVEEMPQEEASIRVEGMPQVGEVTQEGARIQVGEVTQERSSAPQVIANDSN